MQLTVAIANQRWLVTWSKQDTAPPGQNHGSSGVCLTDKGIVLVSRDGRRWEFPAGRPEAEETLLDTLHREVLEEACVEIETANLLGFTISECLEGAEQGLELVRAHWAARGASLAWQPVHEITHRIEVPESEVMSTVTMERGLERMYEEIWRQARSVLGT